MAGNNFNIPTFDIDLLNWSNNVKAHNAARARERQQDWNQVYGTAAALGKQIRAEQEAEKARKEAAEQAAIQREFQAQEAEKARAFQAAENAANRQAQTSNASSMADAEKQKNLGKINAEIAVLEANRDRELGNIDAKDEKTRALINAQFNANKRNVYAKYGQEAPTMENIPTGDTPVPTQNIEVPTAPVETLPTNDMLTGKQQEIENKKIIDGLEQTKRQIETMPKGPKKAAAMKQFNSDSNGMVKGYSEKDIHDADYHIPVYKIGQVVPSDKVATLKQWYNITFSPSKDGYVVIGKKNK